MKECQFCGAKIKDETKPCPACGYTQNASNEIYGDAKEIDSHLIEETPNQSTVDEQCNILPRWVKILLIATTISITPIIGFISGILILTSKSDDYRSFGKKLLIITLVYWVVSFVLRRFFGIIALSAFML
jgi:hypothetical protein